MLAAIKRKLPVMFRRGVVMLQDNACPHLACTIQETLCFMSWKVLGYPIFSPDLSLCDFHVLSPLKKVLKSHKFGPDKDV
jgi:hypothetical protein